MKFRCFLLLYIFILPNELMICGKTGDLCIHKLVKGRLVTEGFCETPNEQDIITQLRNDVEAAKEREKLKTWYKASNNFYYKMFLDQVSYATAKANCQEKKGKFSFRWCSRFFNKKSFNQSCQWRTCVDWIE
ncbi:uncharacterized protein LOC120337719 [Styela clava]